MTNSELNDVTINVEFEETANRQQISSGDEIKTLFGKIKKWLSDLNPVAFSGSYNDLTDRPNNTPANAGAHNCIYRGKYLGDTVTDEQYAEISNGTFDNLFIGDYWTINEINWRIAAFDYYLNCGNQKTLKHHAVIIPDTVLYKAEMGSTKEGYVGSLMYTENIEQARSQINELFYGHVMPHYVLFISNTSSGYPTMSLWEEADVYLMNETMVYGCHFFTSMNVGSNAARHTETIEKSQLPLFLFDPSKIISNESYWLRDSQYSYCFCCVSSYGSADFATATNKLGVRPVFCIS